MGTTEKIPTKRKRIDFRSRAATIPKARLAQVRASKKKARPFSQNVIPKMKTPKPAKPFSAMDADRQRMITNLQNCIDLLESKDVIGEGYGFVSVFEQNGKLYKATFEEYVPADKWIPQALEVMRLEDKNQTVKQGSTHLVKCIECGGKCLVCDSISECDAT